MSGPYKESYGTAYNYEVGYLEGLKEASSRTDSITLPLAEFLKKRIEQQKESVKERCLMSDYLIEGSTESPALTLHLETLRWTDNIRELVSLPPRQLQNQLLTIRLKEVLMQA